MNHGSDGERRVVVTGMGIVSTIGQTLAEYRDSLMAGRSGITRWKHMDGRTESKIGGDLTDFDFMAHLGRAGAHYPSDLTEHAIRLARVTPTSGRITTAAALQAYVDAGWHISPINPERFAHVLAGHNLTSARIRENVLTFEEEPGFVDPLFSLTGLDTDVLSATSELLMCQGPSWTVGAACASGNAALLSGLDLLRSGRADVVLITGGSAALEPTMLQAWALVGAISTRSFNDEPAKASRPWDVRREGFVPSEGAAAVILETLAVARRRSARVYAELLGAASTSDATRLPKPHVTGQARAMALALQDARVRPDQIEYINAHAASTVLGDMVEAEAIRSVFGDRAGRIPINSTKSMIGHCLTSAAVAEFVATVVQMQDHFLHPTINLEEPAMGLDLDFVPQEARQARVGIALSNSFGFGGLNTAVVVSQDVSAGT